MTIHGGCLCGGARFEIHGRITPIELCHCSRCRKSSGTAHTALVAAKAEKFRWVDGEELIRSYQAPVVKEPPGYTRTFCGVCGSPMPVPYPEQPYVIIPVGTLDGDPATRVMRHIFVDAKAPWDEIDDDLPQFPQAPPPELRPQRK